MRREPSRCLSFLRRFLKWFTILALKSAFLPIESTISATLLLASAVFSSKSSIPKSSQACSLGIVLWVRSSRKCKPPIRTFNIWYSLPLLTRISRSKSPTKRSTRAKAALSRAGTRLPRCSNCECSLKRTSRARRRRSGERRATRRHRFASSIMDDCSLFDQKHDLNRLELGSRPLSCVSLASSGRVDAWDGFSSPSFALAWAWSSSSSPDCACCACSSSSPSSSLACASSSSASFRSSSCLRCTINVSNSTISKRYIEFESTPFSSSVRILYSSGVGRFCTNFTNSSILSTASLSEWASLSSFSGSWKSKAASSSR